MEGELPAEQAPPQPSQPEEHEHHHIGQVVTALVVLLILLGLGVWLFGLFDDGGGLSDLSLFGEESTVETTPGQFLTTPEEGKIVSNFPLELILDDIVETENSYSVRYEDQGIDQPIVSFASTQSFEAMENAYATHFDENGWVVTSDEAHTAADGGSVRSLYARRAGEQASVTVTENPEGEVLVTVVYVVFDDLGPEGEAEG